MSYKITTINMDKRLGFLSLLVTSVLFSTYGLFSRILSHQLSVFQQLSYRYAIGVLIVIVITYLVKRDKIDWPKLLRWEMLLFALLIPFSFYMFIESFLASKLSVSISGFYAGVLISSIVGGIAWLLAAGGLT